MTSSITGRKSAARHRARDASLRQWRRRGLPQHRHGPRLSEEPAVGDWAFYPRTDRLRDKMDAEMPLWKQPFWYWIKWFKAWPFSVEALSGLFDFNHAPFFQSFMEVRVERSKKRVVLILNGVDGPLRWRDLQTGGALFPAGASPDDPVELSCRWTVNSAPRASRIRLQCFASGSHIIWSAQPVQNGHVRRR